jgi:flagellar export protein FliJ
MKRFRFRLERVLRFRTTEKEQALSVLMEERSLLNQYNAEVEALQESKRLGEIAEGTVFPSAFIQSIGMFESGVKIRLDELAKQIEAQELVVQKAEQEYLFRLREAEVLVNLKQRSLEEYRKEQLAEEGRELDEFAVTRRARATRI